MKRSTCMLTLFAVVSMSISSLWARGSTRIIARPGQAAHINEHWPKGVDEIVNDQTRTRGWNSSFSEWPSDVQQFALEIKSYDDLQRLIKNLAALKGKKQVVLSALSEPRALGFVTRLDEGNHIPVIFSIGDQEQINEWYKHVRKPFGKIEFVDVPVAVPPTLTLFVGHDLIHLDELEIPEGIDVRFGYVPTVFHKANTKQEQKAGTIPPKILTRKSLSPEQQKIFDKIEAWLQKREAAIESRKKK
jgi:hypothetical protein